MAESKLSSIGSNAFSGCARLQKINIPKTVSSFGNSAFSGCELLATVDLPERVDTLGKNLFNNCKVLDNVTIPSGIDTLDEGLFNGCSSLSELEVPEEIKTICKDVFTGCEHLTLTIPNTVENIDELTFGDKLDSLSKGVDHIKYYGSLTGIDIARWIYAKITRLYKDGLNSNQTNDIKLWESLLTDAEVEVEENKLTKVNENLEGTLVVPDNITKVNSYSFENCTNLDEVKLPETVDDIGKCAFSGCSNLQTVNIPDGVSIIKAGTFNNCSNLNSVIIPESVIEIQNFAFKNCKNLEELKIPETVETTGKFIVAGCEKLENIENKSETVEEENLSTAEAYNIYDFLKEFTYSELSSMNYDQVRNSIL